MKDVGQAMSAFGKALEIDPNCQVRTKDISFEYYQLVLVFRKQLKAIDNVR